MSRPNPAVLFGILVIVLVTLGGVSLLKGGLFIGKHEGDTLHMMEIVFRLAEGQRPHLDFMTPIGGLAFAPIALFVQAGVGIGNAFIFAQILVAVAFLPAVWWVSVGRLTPLLAASFGTVIMVLILALVHGEAHRAVSVSMHYNRWAWSAAFVAILAAIIPPVHPKSALADGVIIGLMMTVMAMIKVTYFVSFAVPIALALVMTGQRRAFVFAVVTGLMAVAGLSLWLGVDYWVAYANDLIAVAQSEFRSSPGEAFGAVLGAPAYLGASLTGLAGVIFLRQSRAATAGLVLLLLLPGFFYVTYQNFGNDPQWLMLLAVILLALRPASDLSNASGWNLRQAVLVCAVAAMALSAPSFFNLLYSPFRHLRMVETDHAPMLPRGGVHADLLTTKPRALQVNAMIALDRNGVFDIGQSAAEENGREEQPEFMGEAIADCEIESGMVTYFDVVSRDLEAAGFGGARIFAADLFSSFWLYGDFDMLIGGSPWNYGGLPGFASADFLLVPVCPTVQSVQARIFKDIEALESTTLIEARRTPSYILYEIVDG